MKKIPLKILKNMKKRGSKKVNPYTHKNFLVRWIFWKRLKTMLKFADLSKKRVLDFGAGSGVFTFILSEKVKEVYSLDLDISSLKYIKKKYNLSNVKIVKNKGEILPFRDNFFDIIFAADVLEHFKDSTKIQEEFKRVLKNNGMLIISAPIEDLIYRMARKFIFGYEKPKDHYSNAKEILKKTRRLFKIEKVKNIPFGISGFKIYRGRKIE